MLQMSKTNDFLEIDAHFEIRSAEKGAGLSLLEVAKM